MRKHIFTITLSAILVALILLFCYVYYCVKIKSTPEEAAKLWNKRISETEKK